MSFWQEHVSYKSLIIGLVAGSLLVLYAAYLAGIKEVASPFGLSMAALYILFLVLVMYRFRVKQQKYNSLIEDLQNRHQKDAATRGPSSNR